MTQLMFAVLVVCCMLAVIDWRKGLVICVLVGISQDPLRKLAPGQPVYYVVFVGLVFAVTWVRAAMLGVPLTPKVIHDWKRHLQLPFSVFVAIVVAQAFHSYARYGSAFMTGIGLLVWLAPLPAVMLAYQFAVRRGLLGVRQWMLFYVPVALVSLSGVYFEYVGYDWRTLGEIGEGQVIYDVGTILKAHSGFFRSSEIAAWHTATIACFVFILSIGKRPTVFRVAGALLMICVLVGLGILTGRRKMLVEITVFLSIYMFLVAWLQRGAARLAVAVLMIGAMGYVAVVGFVDPDPVQRTYSRQAMDAHRMETYAARSQTVFADLPRRFNELGVQPIMWSIGTYGWLGAGLGTGSQGTNAIAESHNLDRSAAEGGLGKITMELGLPGLMAGVWLLFALGKHLQRQLVATARLSPQHARVSYGLLGFLVANVATFSVATQAYSDLFILLIIGWMFGFLFAMPVLAASGDSTRRRARRPAPVLMPDYGFAPTQGSAASLPAGQSAR